MKIWKDGSDCIKQSKRMPVDHIIYNTLLAVNRKICTTVSSEIIEGHSFGNTYPCGMQNELYRNELFTSLMIKKAARLRDRGNAEGRKMTLNKASDQELWTCGNISTYH